jgi:hypothetical protein
MATSGGPKIITDGLAFGYDTGYPMVASGNDTTYKFNKGAPIFNIARAMTSWPTRARVTVSLYTGSIQPPIPGEAIYKLICNADNAGILCRDGGYYYAGGNWGSGTVQNTNILSDGTNQYTPLGNNKFVYSLYVRPTENTLDTTAAYIDIGDKNSVNVQNVDDLTDWHKLETTDAIQINNTAYPYDFIDFAYSPNTIGNELLVSAIQLLRTPGSDSGSLKTPSPGTQYLTYGADRSFSGSLIDLTRTTDIDLSNMSFDSNAHITFDGTDDSIPIPSTTLGNGDWTVEFVANAHSSGYHMMSNSSGGPVTNAMGVYSNKLYYRNYDGAWQAISSNTTVNYNEIYHLVYVNRYGGSNNSGSMDMYINGEKDSNSGANSYTTNGGPVNAIGRSWAGYFDGEIYICKRYTTGLSDEEVKQNYNAIKSRFGLT